MIARRLCFQLLYTATQTFERCRRVCWRVWNETEVERKWKGRKQDNFVLVLFVFYSPFVSRVRTALRRDYNAAETNRPELKLVYFVRSIFAPLVAVW